tara:strand:+ start:1520 stop:3874 length:2355 start_codon:yes stop_codon:yes gene_type:complete
MAQEDYFSSQTGQVAGTLLAKGDDKDDAAKAVILGLIQQFAKNAKEGLKQSVLDGSKDVANKWSGIMESLGSDYDNASEDRQNLKEYKRSPTKYLTKKAIENIDLVTEGKNFTYANRFGKNVTDAQRATLAEAITQEKLELKKAMDLMLKDPKLTINNKVDFLNPALMAGRAADKAVLNDPTKRNLVASFYNRIFKTEKNEDGELVTTNGKLIKLRNDADVANNRYLDQQKKLDEAELSLESHFEGLLGEPVEKFNFDKVAPVTIPVTADEKEKQMTLNNNVLFNKQGNPNKEYWSVSKDVTLRSSNTDKTKSAKVVDIKKYKFENILIVDEDGEVRDFSPLEFIQSVTTRQVRIRKAIEAREDGTSPDIGVISFDGALDAFAREGRFVEVSALNQESFWKKSLNNKNFNLANSNSIIFIKPNTNVVSNQEVNTSDLIQAGEDNSLTDEEENLNKDKGDSSVYSHIAVEAMMINKNFINASVEIQNREVAELINDHPEKEEEITKLYDSFKENITPINNFITEDNYNSLGIESFVTLTDRPIINKIIEVESSGKPNRISKHGAKGYMQLKDSTADNPGIEGVPPVVRDKGGNISHEENIIFGTNYYDGLVRKYDGDMVTAAMAYNLGFGAIDTWISEGRNFGELRKETQDYVKKVFGQDIYDKVKSGEYGNNEIEIPKTTELNTSSDSLLNRAPEKQDVTSSAQRKEKANEMFSKMTTVPSLLRERGKNQERERVTDFLSGERSSFSSASYTSWKRENDIVDNYSTSRKEKEKNVKNYLEFLNQ